MKDQYFGDVNDYSKCGLLRVLADGGRVRTGVCWMLTKPNSRGDGQKTRYLSQPEKWRDYDPELFDFLRETAGVGNRAVSLIEESGVLPGATFFSDLLPDDRAGRERYFDAMFEQFADRDLIFFDPDNGLEVPSVPMGGRKSSKYVYWPEVTRAWELGKSVLIFQHFTREKRESLAARLLERAKELTGAGDVLTLWTPSVLYLLLVHAMADLPVETANAFADFRSSW